MMENLSETDNRKICCVICVENRSTISARLSTAPQCNDSLFINSEGPYVYETGNYYHIDCYVDKRLVNVDDVPVIADNITTEATAAANNTFVKSLKQLIRDGELYTYLAPCYPLTAQDMLDNQVMYHDFLRGGIEWAEILQLKNLTIHHLLKMKLNLNDIFSLRKNYGPRVIYDLTKMGLNKSILQQLGFSIGSAVTQNFLDTNDLSLLGFEKICVTPQHPPKMLWDNSGPIKESAQQLFPNNVDYGIFATPVSSSLSSVHRPTLGDERRTEDIAQYLFYNNTDDIPK